MKPVSVNAFVDINVEDIAKSITPEELGGVFCYICEHFARSANTSFKSRRQMIGQIADGLHEDAICMLGEVVALAYHRVRGESAGNFPAPMSPTLPPSPPKDDMDVPF